MSLRFSLLGASGALVLSCSGLLAQDGPPVNIQQILRELDQIEATQKQSLLTTKQSTVARLKAASNNAQAAGNLYIEAIEAIQFEGKKNKGGSFANWKDAAADVMRNREAQAVLMLHLKYIVLSIERKMSGKGEDFVQPSLAYAVELYNADTLFMKQSEKSDQFATDKERKVKQSAQEIETMNIVKRAGDLRKELLDKPITDSVFTKWLRMAAWYPKSDEWEMVPGNVSGILEKNVRPFMRLAKDPKVVETWEFEMKVLADRATGSRLEHQMTEFNTVVRPRLQLGRANDMVEMGQKNRAVSEIYSMIKNYPQHADFSKWVQRLRELAKTMGPAGAATEAAPAEAEGAATAPSDTSPQ